MTCHSPRAFRVAAVLAASALALTACSGGDDEPTATADTTSASATPSSTVEVPKGLESPSFGTLISVSTPP